MAFTLTAADTPEYRNVTHELQQNWRTLGVNLQVQLLSAADFQRFLAGNPAAKAHIDQVAAIVGSVVRTIPHSGSQPGTVNPAQSPSFGQCW